MILFFCCCFFCQTCLCSLKMYLSKPKQNLFFFFCAQTLIFQIAFLFHCASVRSEYVNISVTNEHIWGNLTENEDHTSRQMVTAMQSA